MSIPTPILRAARLAMAVLALALAATAVSPAASNAQPNQGGGGDSSYCSSLLDRLKRYHAIATDPSQPQGVRDFYRNRAAIVLVRAQSAGCTWATSMQAIGSAATLPDAALTSRGSAASVPGGPAVRAQRRATFDRLTATRRQGARAGKRGTAGGGTRVPSSQTSTAAIKATSTGNAQHDQYCADVAKLIDEADAAGDDAFNSGNAASADLWWELADYFTDVATQNGCRFTMVIKTQPGMRAPAAVAVRR